MSAEWEVTSEFQGEDFMSQDLLNDEYPKQPDTNTFFQGRDFAPRHPMLEWVELQKSTHTWLNLEQGWDNSGAYLKSTNVPHAMGTDSDVMGSTKPARQTDIYVESSTV